MQENNPPSDGERQRLEELVQRQRCLLVFAQSMYSEVCRENARLRAIIAEAGLSFEPSALPDPEQLVLPLEESVQAAG